jgi:hypothetical protein
MKEVSQPPGHHRGSLKGQRHVVKNPGAGLNVNLPDSMADLPVSEVAATCSRLLLRAIHKLVHARETFENLSCPSGAADGTHGAGTNYERHTTPSSPHIQRPQHQGEFQGEPTGTAKREEALKQAVGEVWVWCVTRAPLATLVDELLPAWRNTLQWFVKCEVQLWHCAPECAAALLDATALQTACQVCYCEYGPVVTVWLLKATRSGSLFFLPFFGPYIPFCFSVIVSLFVRGFIRCHLLRRNLYW